MRLNEFERRRPKFLYHATDTSNEQSILNNGISRRSKSIMDGGIDSYDNRIYFFDAFNKSEITNYMETVISDRSIYGDGFKLPFVVFQIDTAKLPENFVFHHDEWSFTPGVDPIAKKLIIRNDVGPLWTDSGDIPPESIRVVWRSKVDDTKNPMKAKYVEPQRSKDDYDYQVVDPGLTHFEKGQYINQEDYDDNSEYGLTVKKL